MKLILIFLQYTTTYQDYYIVFEYNKYQSNANRIILILLDR